MTEPQIGAIPPVSEQKSLPLYQVIADDLRGRITRGEFAVGAMLPTEKELLQGYRVSRHTVRAALQQLREQGFVSMRRGSGTRVESSSPGAAYVQSVKSLSELLQYPETSFEVADTGMVTLSPGEAASLSLSSDTTWFRITGLRRSDITGIPICWQEIYVLPEFENTARRVLTEHGPVHRIIESAHSEVIANAQLKIFASRVDKELADSLEVERGSAAMTIHRRYTSQDGRIFETTVSIHPEDRFVYSLELSRDWNTN